MYEGVLIAESLKIGTELDQRLSGRKITRIRRGDTTARQPSVWALIEFDLAAERAQPLAESLSDALQVEGGWYCDYRSDHDVYVIFAGRTFHYRRGDDDARAEAVAYGRSVGVPEPQLDWAR